jgi:hypothetical protein
MEIQGTQEVLANVNKVIKVVSKSTKEGLIEIGERGVNYLKIETSSFVDTGRLRQSMSYTIDNKVYNPLGNEDNVKPSNEKDSVYIGTNVVYARHVEYLAKNGSQGYMLRAYKRTKDAAEKIMQKVIKGAVR